MSTQAKIPTYTGRSADREKSTGLKGKFASDENPEKVVLKQLVPKVPNTATFRILDLHEDGVVTIEGYKTYRYVQPKATPAFYTEQFIPESYTMGTNEPYHVNDLEGLYGMRETARGSEEYERVPLNECYRTTLYRFPVIILDAPGSNIEKDEVRFLECNGSFLKLLKEVQADNNVDFSINEDTGTPEYSLLLTRLAASGSKTYGLAGVMRSKGKDGKFTNDPTYRVPLEEVYGEAYEALAARVGEVMQSAIAEIVDKPKIVSLLNQATPRSGTIGLAAKPTAEGETELEDTSAEEAEQEAEPVAEVAEDLTTSQPKKKFSFKKS